MIEASQLYGAKTDTSATDACTARQYVPIEPCCGLLFVLQVLERLLAYPIIQSALVFAPGADDRGVVYRTAAKEHAATHLVSLAQAAVSGTSQENGSLQDGTVDRMQEDSQVQQQQLQQQSPPPFPQQQQQQQLQQQQGMAEAGEAYPGVQVDSGRMVMAIEIQPSHVSAVTCSTLPYNTSHCSTLQVA
jgi:hypothetical protein